MGCRIFLSYGHDEHAELARRLKADLVARGHEVWFDDRLLPGSDWEAWVEEGLEWVASDPARARFILLMTPHAVRRPDGYCLNELARAIGRGLRIIPVMVAWVEPPLSICRIQWLDLRDCVPINARPAAYDSKLDVLLAALENDHEALEGAQARLMALLDPLPFEAEISQHLIRFTGREWMLEKVDAWISNPAGTKIFWITGEPGIGKSALAAKLAASRPEVAAVHFCRHGHAQKGDARRTVLSIVYQLSTQLPEYEARLNALPLQSLIPESDAYTLFDRLILQPLLGNLPNPNRTLVILIDALDEVSQDRRNELADFLADEFPKTPPWLRLIITSRPDPEIVYSLQAIMAERMDPESVDNEDDIRAFLQRELKLALPAASYSDTVIARMLELSEGNFLYIEWLRKEIAAGRVSAANIEELPKGLGGIYSQFARRQWADVPQFRRDVAPALDLIAAARQSLDLELLGRILGWSDRQRNDFVAALGSLFACAGSRILPFHKSLLDWLTDRSKAGPYYVSVADGHRQLTEHCWLEFHDSIFQLSSYARHHLPGHLIVERRWDDLETLLTSLAFLEAKAESDDVFALSADFSHAVAVLPTERPLNRIVRLLDEAIRRELHFIGRHPKSIFQCLWNAGWWFDCPEAAQFSGSTGPVPASQRFGTASRLHELLERWCKEKSAREPQFAWLRSLFPPRLPLGSGLRFELRGHTARVSSLAVSPDGAIIASGSNDRSVRLWSAKTGKNILTTACHGDIDDLQFSKDGRLLLWNDLRQAYLWDMRKAAITLSTDQNAIISSTAIIEPGSIAIGMKSGRLYLYEMHSGSLQQTFDVPGEVAAMAGVGAARIVFATGALMYELDTAGGGIAKLGHCEARITKLSLSPHGSFLAVVVRDKHCVRIWDLRCSSWTKSFEVSEASSDVAWSKDNQLLISTYGGRIQIFDVVNGKPVASWLAHPARIWFGFPICCSTKEGWICSGEAAGSIAIWEHFKTDAEMIARNANMGQSPRLHVVAQGHYAISTASSPDQAQSVYSAPTDIHIAQPFAARKEIVLSGHRGSVNEVRFSPDGMLIASGGYDTTARVWDSQTGRELWCFRGHEEPVRCVSFSRDSRLLASGGTDRRIAIWDLSTGALMRRLEGHQCALECLAFSNDGARLVSADSGVYADDAYSIRVWDAATGEELQQLSGMLRGTQAIAVAPDGLIASLGGGWSPFVALQDCSAKVEPFVANGVADVDAIARAVGRDDLLCFSDDQEVFVRRGFSEAPLAWFPVPLERIVTDPVGPVWGGETMDGAVCLIRLERGTAHLADLEQARFVRPGDSG